MPTWEARLARTTELLSSVTMYPEKELAVAAESFYKKLVAADAYQPANKYSGPVTLVRAQDNYVTLGNDYGLTPVRIINMFYKYTNLVYIS